MCDGIVGAHPDGTPLGKPVMKKVRELRHRVHQELRELGLLDGKSQQNWLYANELGDGHIGNMDEAECRKALQIMGRGAPGDELEDIGG